VVVVVGFVCLNVDVLRILERRSARETGARCGGENKHARPPPIDTPSTPPPLPHQPNQPRRSTQPSPPPSPPTPQKQTIPPTHQNLTQIPQKPSPVVGVVMHQEHDPPRLRQRRPVRLEVERLAPPPDDEAVSVLHVQGQGPHAALAGERVHAPLSVCVMEEEGGRGGQTRIDRVGGGGGGGKADQTLIRWGGMSKASMAHRHRARHGTALHCNTMHAHAYLWSPNIVGGSLLPAGKSPLPPAPPPPPPLLPPMLLLLETPMAPSVLPAAPAVPPLLLLKPPFDARRGEQGSVRILLPPLQLLVLLLSRPCPSNSSGRPDEADEESARPRSRRRAAPAVAAAAW
jgi:hypothetical protein